MIVINYDELRFYLEMFRSGDMDLLVLESRGGLGKSRLAEDLMRDVQHVKVHSHITPLSLYFLGYEYRNLPIVFDDVDSLLTNDLSVALLKMFCETRKVKTIGWYSTHNLLKVKNVPQTYETKSKVCILTNDFKVLTKKILSLKDRAWHIEFQPTDRELLDKIREIKGYYDVEASPEDCDEVYNLIKRYSKFCDFSLRTYVKGLAVLKQCKRTGRKGWQEILLREMRINPKLILIGNLMSKHKGDKKRIEVWEGHGFSTRSFYGYKSKFLQKCKSISNTPNPNTRIPKPVAEVHKIINKSTGG